MIDRSVVWSTELLRDVGIGPIGRRDQPSFRPVGTMGYLIGGNFLPNKNPFIASQKIIKIILFFFSFLVSLVVAFYISVLNFKN